VDCSWRRLPTLLRQVDGDLLRRRLPAAVTAYPRRSQEFPDPDRGLASVEALFLALLVLGEPDDRLLECYPFREQFLASNATLLAALGRTDPRGAPDS
jgi:pre-rRNA-processing protein TSR3